MAYVKPKGLAWMDFETTGLSVEDDQILEFSIILTDFDLKPQSAFKSHAIGFTEEGRARLDANDYVTKMHTTSGLIADCEASEYTGVEEYVRVMNWLEESGYGPQELIIAGSGVSHFDVPLMRYQMEELANYFQYYTADIGNVRRFFDWWTDGARDGSVPQVEESFKDGVKAHRAWDDTKAHIKEAQVFRQWVRAHAFEAAQLSADFNPPVKHGVDNPPF